VVLFAAASAAAAAWARNLLADPQPQGRLAFGALAAVAALVAYGWLGSGALRRGQGGSRSGRMATGWAPLAVFVGILAAADLVALSAAIPHGYRPWRRVPPQSVVLTVPPGQEVPVSLGDGMHASQSMVLDWTPNRMGVAVHSGSGPGVARVSVALGGRPVSTAEFPLSRVEANRWLEIHLPETATTGHGQPETYVLEVAVIGGGRLDLFGESSGQRYPSGALSIFDPSRTHAQDGGDISVVAVREAGQGPQAPRAP
jgi:hypothetical protein